MSNGEKPKKNKKEKKDKKSSPKTNKQSKKKHKHSKNTDKVFPHKKSKPSMRKNGRLPMIPKTLSLSSPPKSRMMSIMISDRNHFINVFCFFHTY